MDSSPATLASTGCCSREPTERCPLTCMMVCLCVVFSFEPGAGEPQYGGLKGRCSPQVTYAETDRQTGRHETYWDYSMVVEGPLP